MSTLHDWQKIRTAEIGWTFVVTKARTIWCWEGGADANRVYARQRKKLRLKRGELYRVYYKNRKREFLWLRNDRHTLVVKYEDARLSGGVFPDRLRAEVFKARELSN